MLVWDDIKARFCKDCVHFHEDYKCAREEFAYSMVDGKKFDLECMLERSSQIDNVDNRCGYEGKFFRKREEN